MAKIPSKKFAEKLAEKVNVTDETAYNFVLQLSDEGKLKRTKIKNRWHFDDDDLYKASNAWLFSEQFISSLTTTLNALPNNTWEKIRLLLQEISKFDFMPICFAYERERKIPTINKENHDMAKFLLDLIDRLERHLLEGYSDTWLQFRPPYRYQGFCHAFGMLTAHLGGCYTATHDLNKFCYTQNALAEFINGRFTSKAVDFDIFLRHFGLNVDDFILPINEDKDKFFDDRPPVVTNAPVSVPAPVQASFVTSHGGDTVGKKISLQTLTQATTNSTLSMEDCNMYENFAQEKITRISMAENFFNLLFGNVTERKFGYLWAKQGEEKETYPFTVSNPDERRQMAIKAIELSDAGFDVYYGINLGDKPPVGGSRLNHKQVTLQTATVTDIDIEGGTHISNKKKKYAPTFDTAKSFLPFTASLIVNSGYGMHALCLYSEPITITDDNRLSAKERNEKFLDVIRNNAGVYEVDGVGDLPRVLRVPGTFNYKCGRDNAPLCQLVETNDVRFTPADFDEKLKAATPPTVATSEPTLKTTPTTTSEPARTPQPSQHNGFAPYVIDDDPLYREFRIRRMLEHINVVDGEYEKWRDVGFGLYNEGMPCSMWEQWSRTQPEFKEGECEEKWKTFGYEPSGITVKSLHEFAKEGGYSERDTQRDWYQLHPELSARAKRQKNGTTQDFIRDCPVNLVIPADFKIGYNGITYLEPSRKENGKPRVVSVAHTPIIPTKIFREPHKNKYTYEIAILNRGVWKTAEIEGRTLADARAIIALNDDGALINEPKILCRFLTSIISLNPNLREVKVYTQTGWTNDEFTDFAYIGNEDCIIRRGDFNFERDLADRGDAELWKQKFVEVSEQGGAIAHAYIGIALAAILARPLNIMNPQTHLFGTSGSGKTALQKFTASIFGNPRKLKRSFAATSRNRQLAAAAFCDLPTFIDELETIPSKKVEETLSNDVYNFADGKGNQANKRDGTARETFEFGGARLTTGERPILKQNDLRGAFKRLLQFGINDPIFDDEFATDLHIFSESNFGHFAKPWIQFAITHMAEIQAKYQNYAKKDPSTQNYEPSHLKMLAAALVAFEFFKVMLGINAEFDAIELIRDRRYLIDYQLPTLDQMDDATRAVEFLQSLVAGNDKSLAHEVNKPDFDNEYTQSANECYGKVFKNGEVAILPHIFKELLEKRGGFPSADKLRLDFYNKGLLRHTEGKMTFPTRFNGKTQKMIRFKAGVLSSPQTDEILSAQAD